MNEDPDWAFISAMISRGHTLEYILGLNGYERLIYMAAIMNEGSDDA